jgi:serine/threonine protein kinase
MLVTHNGIVKIADFGLSRILSPLEVSHSVVGTPAYLAPETQRTPPVYDSRVDVWALGAVLFEFISGKQIVTSFDQLKAMSNVETANAFKHPIVHLEGEFHRMVAEYGAEVEVLTLEIRELLSQMLQLEPSARATASELLKHRCLKRPFTVLLLGRTGIGV